MSHVLMWRAADAGGAVAPHRIVKYGDADGKVVQSAAAADAHVGVSGRASAVSGAFGVARGEGVADGPTLRVRLASANSTDLILEAISASTGGALHGVIGVKEVD